MSANESRDDRQTRCIMCLAKYVEHHSDEDCITRLVEQRDVLASMTDNFLRIAETANDPAVRNTAARIREVLDKISFPRILSSIAALKALTRRLAEEDPEESR